MDPSFWNDRWKQGDIGFHRAEVHDLLAKHWDRLVLPAGSLVFVPLCGKSLDMVWLAEQGHRVVGAELSNVAVDAFFAERNLSPSVETVQGFTVKKAGPYEIWCGDFFNLPKEAVAGAAAVYDRAALVSFPPADQPRYGAKLAALTPLSAPIAMICLAFDPSEMEGPPFPAPLVLIASIFGSTRSISIMECRDGLEQSQNLKARGLTRLEESLYVLRQK